MARPVLNVQTGSGISAAVAARVSEATAGATGGGRTVVRVRRLDTAEIVLIALWLAYPLTSAVADVLGLQPG